MDHPRKPLQNRLKRIAGQITGLQKMVDEDRYCVDILTQLAAIRSALDALGVELLTNHLEHCMIDAKNPHKETSSRTKTDLVDEMKTTLARFLK